MADKDTEATPPQPVVTKQPKERTEKQKLAFQKCLQARELALRKKIAQEEAARTPQAAMQEDVIPEEEHEEEMEQTSEPAAEQQVVEQEEVEYVDFNPDDVYTRLNEALAEVQALRESVSSLHSGHEELSSSWRQHNITKAHSIQFV